MSCRSLAVISPFFFFLFFCIFFFQAEDGIRDSPVTGVQTCALPISGGHRELRGLRRDAAGAVFGGAVQVVLLHGWSLPLMGSYFLPSYFPDRKPSSG